MTFQLVLDFLLMFADDDDRVLDIGGAVLFMTQLKHSSMFLGERNCTRRDERVVAKVAIK